MVRIDGCVQVWSVAGLYLGPEKPAKLLPARVFPAVELDLTVGHSCVGRRVQRRRAGVAGRPAGGVEPK